MEIFVYYVMLEDFDVDDVCSVISVVSEFVLRFINRFYFLCMSIGSKFGWGVVLLWNSVYGKKKF